MPFFVCHSLHENRIPNKDVITFFFELTEIAIYYSHDVQRPPTKSFSEPVSQIWILKFKTNIRLINMLTVLFSLRERVDCNQTLF